MREPDPTTYRALLVGNARFGDPRLRKLDGPVNDVERLKRALVDGGVFEEERVRVLPNRSKGEVETAAESFFIWAGKDDHLLFYYSGHGVLDSNGTVLYLCLCNTDTQLLVSTAMSTSALADMIERSPAKVKILVLDCCSAGSFVGGWMPWLFQAPGLTVLMAGPPREPVPDAARPGQPSPFTARLLEAFRQPDRDGDGFILLRDLTDYLSSLAGPEMGYMFQRGGVRLPDTVIARAIAIPSPEAPITPTMPAPPTGPSPLIASPPLKDLPSMVPVPPSVPLLYVGAYLVTNHQFWVFLKHPANQRWRPHVARARRADVDQEYLALWDGMIYRPELESHPVVNVSYPAARAYAAWAGGLLGAKLRLPSPAEWEAAAQAGRAGDWLQSELDAGRVNFRSTQAAPTAVGEFGANPYGLCDLVGNVYDLCVGERGEPGLCGGAFHTPESRLLEQQPMNSARCRPDVGFRCVRDPLAGEEGVGAGE